MPKVTQRVLGRAASRTQISGLLVPGTCLQLHYRAKLAWAQGCRNSKSDQSLFHWSVSRGEICPFSTWFFDFFPGPWRHCTFLLCQVREGAGMLLLALLSYQFPCPRWPRVMPLPCSIFSPFCVKIILGTRNCSYFQETANSLPILQIYPQMYTR